jgi:Tfp pilus assembly PilM family ATPase
MSSSLSRNLFLRLFPPPRFLEMPAIGMDISDEMVRYVRAPLQQVVILSLENLAKREIPPDIIELGFIKDKEGLVPIMKELRKESKGSSL